jgi:glycosyltransferase involved in cell wall biosynthesis
MHVFALGEACHGGGLRSAYRNWAVARGLERARLIIANSEWTKAQLGTATGRVIVSPEGLRHDLFNTEGARGSPGVAGRYVLWASNLYPYKRIELALAAYAGLPKETRTKLPFVVAGGDWSGGRARAQATAVRLGIVEDVRFLGWVCDELLPELYRGAQVHVLSTAHETFGRSVLESMACGCPNVLQDLPVLREVAGDCAVYVDFGAVPAATAALALLCSDRELQAQMGAAGVDRSKSFSFERLARERVGAVLAAIGKGPS